MKQLKTRAWFKSLREGAKDPLRRTTPYNGLKVGSQTKEGTLHRGRLGKVTRRQMNTRKELGKERW